MGIDDQIAQISFQVHKPYPFSLMWTFHIIGTSTFFPEYKCMYTSSWVYRTTDSVLIRAKYFIFTLQHMYLLMMLLLFLTPARQRRYGWIREIYPYRIQRVLYPDAGCKKESSTPSLRSNHWFIGFMIDHVTWATSWPNSKPQAPFLMQNFATYFYFFYPTLLCIDW